MSTNENTDFVNLNKTADILQATFKHYYDMAMDHHTKAGTTSTILLAIVGAIITLVTYRKESGSSDTFVVGGLAVLVIGLFGAVWVWKQHERYRHWATIAKEYQKELANIVRMLKTQDTYKAHATEEASKKFTPLFAKYIKDRYLWVSLHIIIALIGLGLMLVGLCQLSSNSI